MKITKLLLFLALLGHCFSDECADEFQQLIKTQCESINSTCRFHEFKERCIATVDECSKGNGDSNFCEHIITSAFPQKKCKYHSNSSCLLEDSVCSDFNNGIAGITFDSLKNRSLCDGFKASDDKKNALLIVMDIAMNFLYHVMMQLAVLQILLIIQIDANWMEVELV